MTNSPPVDVNDEPIQLYLNRRITIEGCPGHVIGYGMPRHGYVWFSVQQDDTKDVHGLLIRETYVEDELRKLIVRRESPFDVQVRYPH
jgi:hypothetical protein